MIYRVKRRHVYPGGTARLVRIVDVQADSHAAALAAIPPPVHTHAGRIETTARILWLRSFEEWYWKRKGDRA